ncbi:MAG: AI-2E family transporter [Desulforhabdus sp.]|jgi:predicted PurR-regulated permease PerM|nr:AI-2E family transporter [Desulforhabdus sp.]
MGEPERHHRGSTVRNAGHRPFMLVLLLFALYLAYLTLRPFLHTIVFAIVFAMLLHPLQLRLVGLYRGRKNLAALTVVFVLTFLIALPVFLFISALVNQGLDTMSRVNEWIREGNLEKLTDRQQLLSVEEWLKQHLSFVDFEKIDLQSNLLGFTSNFGQFALKNAANILENVVSQVSHFFVMIFVVFYLVRDGKEILTTIKYLSPLRDEQEERIFDGIRAVTRSVLLGSFLTALCQGLAGGIGLAIVGIPALFWGTVMGFSSLIPVVGTALVWGPAVIYLLLLGKWQSGVFLLIWSLLLVGSIDNFLRPFLMRGENNLSPFYIFLAIIGGVQYFGLAGILYGPLILTLAMVMLYIYSVEYRDLLDDAHGSAPEIERQE